MFVCKINVYSFFCLFIHGVRGKSVQLPPPCQSIERTDKLSVLGVVINDRMTTADHVGYLLSSCSSPWPDDSHNVWFAQAYQTIHTGGFVQKWGWFVHWWWWFAQVRFFVVAPCRELHLATKYIWDNAFTAYIALKCPVTDNWHEWVVCDRDPKPCCVLWFTRWPVNITFKPDN